MRMLNLSFISTVPAVRISGSMTIIDQPDERLYIGSFIIRCNACATVPSISAKQAYAASHSFGIDTAGQPTDFLITDVQQTWYELRGLLVPAYQFIGQATWPDGTRGDIFAVTDAIDRTKLS